MSPSHQLSSSDPPLTLHGLRVFMFYHVFKMLVQIYHFNKIRVYTIFPFFFLLLMFAIFNGVILKFIYLLPQIVPTFNQDNPVYLWIICVSRLHCKIYSISSLNVLISIGFNVISQSSFENEILLPRVARFQFTVFLR